MSERDAHATTARPPAQHGSHLPMAEHVADAIAEWDTTGLLTAEQALDLAMFLVTPRMTVRE